MRNPILVVLSALSLLVSCSTSGPSVDHETLGVVGYSVPHGWQSKELGTTRRPTVEWTPADNPNKESVTIVYTEPLVAVAKAGPAYMERMLAQAQQSLPKGNFTAPTRFTSKNGLVGVQVEGDFTPAGTKEPYRRIHAVVIFDASLVHVLYTANVADRESFEIVVDSLYRRAG